MKFQCEIFRDEIPQEASLLKALRQISQRGAKWSLPHQPYDALTLILQNNQLTLRCEDVRTTVEVVLPCVNGLRNEQSREAQTITVPATLLDYWLALTQCNTLEFETQERYPNGLQATNLRITSVAGTVRLPLRPRRRAL